MRDGCTLLPELPYQAIRDPRLGGAASPRDQCQSSFTVYAQGIERERSPVELGRPTRGHDWISKAGISGVKGQLMPIPH